MIFLSRNKKETYVDLKERQELISQENSKNEKEWQEKNKPLYSNGQKFTTWVVLMWHFEKTYIGGYTCDYNNTYSCINTVTGEKRTWYESDIELVLKATR